MIMTYVNVCIYDFDIFYRSELMADGMFVRSAEGPLSLHFSRVEIDIEFFLPILYLNGCTTEKH